MKKKFIPYSIFILLLSFWLGWTLLVDFVVIRTVFSTISEFFEAGDLGIAVFSKLNNLEMIVSTLLLSLLSHQTLKNKKSLKLLVLGLLGWTIVMIYFTWLTPKLIQLTDLWKAADRMGAIGVSGIQDIQQEHQFYHKLYIRLDSLKIFVLSTLLGVGIWKNEEWE
jgi:hypothetical protein